jgi:hypothetical protein
MALSFIAGADTRATPEGKTSSVNFTSHGRELTDEISQQAGRLTPPGKCRRGLVMSLTRAHHGGANEHRTGRGARRVDVPTGRGALRRSAAISDRM